jgi:predicted extracellular nuclease
VENMAPQSSHLPTVASHIATKLGTPDLLFLQEIQDDSGPKDDGTVSANLTLSNLVAEIAAAGGGVKYKFVEIDPVDKQDGGEPGGNIRQAYL